MPELEDYVEQIRDWEYCYCRDCDKIRYSSELEATKRGIRCCLCGGFNLEAPAWVHCPHDRGGAVKCARAGKGVMREEYGDDCKYHCIFRKP